MRERLLILILVAGVIAGCSADTSVTKDQDKAFRSPSKEIPADIAEKMRKGREKAAAGYTKPGPPAGTTG